MIRLWFVLVVLAVSLGASTPGTRALSGRVLGASGKHTVYVALWQADGFLERPAQQVRLAAEAPAAFHFDVRPGRWAVSAYEDVNGNGALDMGMFGPKEPTGFWRPFGGWRKPRFEDVAASVERDVGDADVRLK
jgi:uncharacterized protein (DUF2141 family)